MKRVERVSRAEAGSRAVYRRLLRAYPRAHRTGYGGPMEQLFADECRDAWRLRGGWGLFCVWARLLPELVKTACWERITSLKGRRFMLGGIFSRFRSPLGRVALFLARCTISMLSVGSIAGIVTFMLPETFASHARIKLGRIPAGGLPSGKDVVSVPMPSSNFLLPPDNLKTELDVIKSGLIMDKVITQLDLTKTWAANNSIPTLTIDEARTLLRRMVEIQPLRNTGIVDIKVYSENKAKAADIANAIAEVYATNARLEAKKMIVAAADPQILGVEVIEHAEIGPRPVRPNNPLNIFLGAVLGLGAGIILGGFSVLALRSSTPRPRVAS